MNTIGEQQVADFVMNNVVKELRIVQNEAGNYEVVINLTWKEGDLYVVTARGQVRDWVSLDRLVRHIKEMYVGTLPPITLTLTG